MMTTSFRTPLLLAFTLIGLAQKGHTQMQMSLVQAQDLAVEHAYAMERARIDVEMAERDIKELLATGLPQVTASFDVNHFLDIPTQVVPASSFDPVAPEDLVLELSFGTTQTMTAGLNASQLIFSGSYLVGLKASQVFADAKALAVDATELETRTLVADAYVTALAARANASMFAQSLELIKTSEEELTAMAAEGLVESVDADQLQLSRQRLEQQLTTAHTQEVLTTQLLLFQCGLSVDEEVELTDDLESLTSASVPEAVMASLDLRAIPSLEEQRKYLTLAELDVQNRRAEGLPQVAAFYSNSTQAFRDPDFPVLADQSKWYPAQIVGLSINMPVWTSFGGKQRVEKAKLQVLTAQSGLTQLESAARLEFEGAKAAFLDAELALNSAEEQRDLAARILERIEWGHKEGVRSSFDLNTAQNQLLQSEGNVIAAQLAWLNAQHRLIASNPRP